MMKQSRAFGPYPAFYVALLAVLTALTTVATLILAIPFPTTQGYFNLGDSLVMISGFLLGPLGGFVAGGVGSAMADLIAAPTYAPITLLSKGLEGALVGLFSRRTRRDTKLGWWDILGLLLGATAMLTGYLFGETLVLGFSWEVAVVEMISINSVQVISGAIVTVLAGPVIREYLRGTTYWPGDEGVGTIENLQHDDQSVNSL
ncbi:MAG: ECF transporter S component [Candidatus Thorarchaeota archaeon]|nr:MAG: ECF transporter S component [Candidatus Thorarchaeota archaeon]